MSNKSRGLQRERAVRDWFEKRDWLVIRAAGSLGDVDLVCLRDGYTPLLVEVKMSSKTRGPYADFGPAAREELRLAARIGGCRATLAWWPPRGQLMFFDERQWPGSAQD